MAYSTAWCDTYDIYSREQRVDWMEGDESCDKANYGCYISDMQDGVG